MVLFAVLYNMSFNQLTSSVQSQDYTINDFRYERFMSSCINCFAKMLYVKFSITFLFLPLFYLFFAVCYT